MDQVVGIDDERHLGARLPDRDGRRLVLVSFIEAVTSDSKAVGRPTTPVERVVRWSE
jgi:hypothetical protein